LGHRDRLFRSAAGRMTVHPALSDRPLRNIICMVKPFLYVFADILQEGRAAFRPLPLLPPGAGRFGRHGARLEVRPSALHLKRNAPGQRMVLNDMQGIGCTPPAHGRRPRHPKRVGTAQRLQLDASRNRSNSHAPVLGGCVPRGGLTCPQIKKRCWAEQRRWYAHRLEREQTRHFLLGGWGEGSKSGGRVGGMREAEARGDKRQRAAILAMPLRG
jgi:hypothetical protein